jgi:hypothetical protein
MRQTARTFFVKFGKGVLLSREDAGARRALQQAKNNAVKRAARSLEPVIPGPRGAYLDITSAQRGLSGQRNLQLMDRYEIKPSGENIVVAVGAHKHWTEDVWAVLRAHEGRERGLPFGWPDAKYPAELTRRDNRDGQFVLAPWDAHRRYKPTGVCWDLHPTDTFDYAGKKVSYEQYLRIKYPSFMDGKRVDPRQPMLEVQQFARGRRGEDGDDGIAGKTCYLIPSLCAFQELPRSIELGDNDRRQLARQGQRSLTQQTEKTNQFVEALGDKMRELSINVEMGRAVEPKHSTIVVREILMGGKRQDVEEADWKRGLRGTPFRGSGIRWKRWAVLCTEAMVSGRSNDFESLLDMMRRGAMLGAEFEQPQRIVARDEDDYLRAWVEAATGTSYELLIVITDSRHPRNAANYAAIKHACWSGCYFSLDRGFPRENPSDRSLVVPCQHLTLDTLRDRKKAMSAVTKVCVQAMVKMKSVPWTVPGMDRDVETLLRACGDAAGRAMVCGIDLRKRRKNGPMLAVLTFSWSTSLTQYGVVVDEYESARGGQMQPIACLQRLFTAALEEFRVANQGQPPTCVLVYRPSMGVGQMEGALLEDLASINRAFRAEGASAVEAGPDGDRGSAPVLALMEYCMTPTQRFGYSTDDLATVENMPAGSVISDPEVQPDGHSGAFFTVAHHSRVFATKPTMFDLVTSTDRAPGRFSLASMMQKEARSGGESVHFRAFPHAGEGFEALKALTIKMSYLYYNWSGAVRVPTCVQLSRTAAEKLSEVYGADHRGRAGRDARARFCAEADYNAVNVQSVIENGVQTVARMKGTSFFL